MATASIANPPPRPPRQTGNDKIDLANIITWAWDFYKSVVVNNLYLKQTEQLDTSTFDASDLPDPASATVASAQQTANEAYTLAATLSASVKDRIGPNGSITISDTSRAVEVTFPEEEESTDYVIIAGCVEYTGTPPAGATLVIEIDKETTGFTLTVNEAPGSGCSTTFNWQMFRNDDSGT